MSDILTLGSELDQSELAKLNDSVLSGSDPSAIKKYAKYFSTAAELQTMDTSAPPMLLEGLLPVNEIALLAGDPGLGKSTIVRQLSLAIARGDKSFLGLKLNAKHRRVLYVSCEDGRLKTARILKHQSGSDTDRLIFLWGNTLRLTDIVAACHDALSRYNVDMIVLDSVGNMIEGDQNRNSDVQVFYKFFSELSEETLCLFLHHMRKRKADVKATRFHIQGAGAFVQRARAVISLTETSGSTKRYLRMEKENEISDEFKYRSLELDFDRPSRSYSATGLITVDTTRPEFLEDGRRDLSWVFHEGESQLSTAEIRERIMEFEDCTPRTVGNWIGESNLRKLERGLYAPPECPTVA